MKREKESVGHFIGSSEKKRINCAEAIIKTYHRDSIPLTEDEQKQFRKCGVGKAPGKVCGAYYAAAYLIERSRPDLKQDFLDYFTEQAGSVVCREIRKHKRLACKECVACAARYMSRFYPEAM